MRAWCAFEVGCSACLVTWPCCGLSLCASLWKDSALCLMRIREGLAGGAVLILHVGRIVQDVKHQHVRQCAQAAYLSDAAVACTYSRVCDPQCNQVMKKVGCMIISLGIVHRAPAAYRLDSWPCCCLDNQMGDVTAQHLTASQSKLCTRGAFPVLTLVWFVLDGWLVWTKC